MKKVMTFILVLVFTGAIPLSCNCTNSCGCDDGVSSKGLSDFNITALGIKTTNPSFVEIDTLNVYAYNEIFKTIYVSDKKYISLHETRRSSSFINEAAACSPAPPKAVETFQEIKIISLTEIALASDNDKINAGQDITDKFVMTSPYNSNANIGDFIKQHNVIYDSDMFRIRLSQKPYKETRLKIKINILMTNGTTFLFDNEIMNVM